MTEPDCIAILKLELHYILEELAHTRSEGPYKQWLENTANHYQQLLDKKQGAVCSGPQ